MKGDLISAPPLANIYGCGRDTLTGVCRTVAIKHVLGLGEKLAVDSGTNYGIYEYNFDTDNWRRIYQYSSLGDDVILVNIF